MKSRRSIIRAILFVVRLQKAVASHHAFPVSLRRKNGNGHGNNKRSGCSTPVLESRVSDSKLLLSGVIQPHAFYLCHSPHPLKRCESTKNRHYQTQTQKLFARHRNSAPTAFFARSPTPRIDKPESKQINFTSYCNMVQPYTIRLERFGSAKPQLNVYPTFGHRLASQVILQKQPSLDDRRGTFFDTPSTSTSSSPTSSSKAFVRQGSVETTTEKKRFPAIQEIEENLKKRFKNTMITVYGALTAIEQDDLDSLQLILSKNSVPVNDPIVESTLFGSSALPIALLDVALMLNRRGAANLLLQHGAVENFELAMIDRRIHVVSAAVREHESRLRSMTENKETEKRLRSVEQQLALLRRMQTILNKEELPGSPSDVRAEVTANTRVTIDYNPPTTSSCVVIKYKVEWSKNPLFDEIDGSVIVNDVQESPITISNLEHGQVYTFRLSAGSMWGFGEPTVANPKNLHISSWEDVDGQQSNRAKCLQSILELNCEIEKYRQSPLWQFLFPGTNDALCKKKKSGLRNLFSASTKFIKNVGRGIYLASVVYTQDKILCTVDDCLPIIQIDDNMTSVSHDTVAWLLKLSLSWDVLSHLQDSSTNTWSTNLPLRAKILESVASMHNALGIKNIGRIHHVPLTFSSSTTFLVSVLYVTENQAVQSQGLAMRWMKMNKFIRKKSTNSPLDFLNQEIISMINFFESSQIPLDKGLYLGYMKLQSSLNSIRLFVPDNLPSVLPFVTVRQNPHISKEEWEWLRTIENDEKCGSRPTVTQYVFHHQLIKAVNMLFHDIDVEADSVTSHRLFRFQVIQMHSDVTFVLVFPKSEDVCQVMPSHSMIEDASESCKGCSCIPVPVFEIVNFLTYQPDFIETYCRLNIFLDHFITILNYEKRQCLHEDDGRVYSEQLDVLNEFQQRVEEIWRSSRWVSNVASMAREKNDGYSTTLSYVLNPPLPALLPDDASDVGYHSDQSSTNKINGSALHNQVSRQSSKLNPVMVFDNRTPPTTHRDATLTRSRSVVENCDDVLKSIDKMYQQATNNNHTCNISPSILKRPPPKRQQSEATSRQVSGFQGGDNSLPSPRSNQLVRVYIAIDCGLPTNCSIRLTITSTTTAKEIVMLVIDQINKLLKSNATNLPLISSNDAEYCLVAIIGARERRLRDEFHPVKLTPPWSHGRIYVRRCDDIQAAIRHGNESFV